MDPVDKIATNPLTPPSGEKKHLLENQGKNFSKLSMKKQPTTTHTAFQGMFFWGGANPSPLPKSHQSNPRHRRLGQLLHFVAFICQEPFLFGTLKRGEGGKHIIPALKPVEGWKPHKIIESTQKCRRRRDMFSGAYPWSLGLLGVVS